jgi:hypothetical protein
MVPDLNVFGAVMKHWIFKELNAALIVTVYDCGLQSLTEKSHKKLPQPNSLAGSQASWHILDLS